MPYLTQLGARNFRLFDTLSLRLHRRLNCFYGPNAAGKTSLLEMVYCLGRGRSFRTTVLQECVGRAGQGWQLRGRLVSEQGMTEQLDAEWSAGLGLALRQEGRAVSRAELVRAYPVQILEPGLHKLLQEGPSYRRSFLDWGVFHVEHSFLPLWARYSRALRQRNLALRQQRPQGEIAPWTEELAAAGEALHALRDAVLQRLLPGFGQQVQALLQTNDWSVELGRGWPEKLSLREALDARTERDRQLGMTQDGPHRAELRLRLYQRQARTLISRGQQKLLIAALLLAQCQLIEAETQRAPILLVDDFASELAEDAQQRLMACLQHYGGQVLLTAFARPGWWQADLECEMFHVEHGKIERVPA